MYLLSVEADAKTVKGRKKGYLTGIMYLAPFKLSGYQVCPMAEIAGCVGDCLNTAGHGGMAKADADTITVDGYTVKMNTVQAARIARTRMLMENQDAFFEQLIKEIRSLIRRATKNGFTPVVRLNGTSDIRWENLEYQGKTIFQWFSEIQFYDYTKIPNRAIKNIPNYHLTFSYSNRPEFQSYFFKAINFYGNAVNYAVVFMGKILPKQFHSRTVINGDESDLRFADPTGVVVGLLAKGNAKKSTSGFAVVA